MYKKTLFSIIFFINTIIAYSQISNGLYKDSIGNFLKISDTKVEFCLSNLIGEGNLSVKKNTITIYNNLSYKGSTLSMYSHTTFIENKKGEYIFFVKDINNVPIDFVTIYGRKCEFSFNTYTDTDSFGYAKLFFSKIPKDSLIFIEKNGEYYPLKIRLNNLDGGLFEVKLIKGVAYYAEMKKIKMQYKIIDKKIMFNWEYKNPFGKYKKLHYIFTKQE